MRTAVTLVLALLLALSTAGCTSSGTPETPGATPALESGANPAFEIAEPQLNMATLKDLAARRGERLTWEDLNSYYHAEIGWELYLLCYPIDADYVLLMGGNDMGEAPKYIRLAYQADLAHSIDVRYEDVDKFLSGDS